MKLDSNVVLQELFLSQKGINNSSHLKVTTPDKRYSFKIDFQQTRQTRQRPHYFLQIWSDNENERRAFANNSMRVASIFRVEIPIYKLHVLSLRFFFTSQVQQHGWKTRARERAYRTHAPTRADTVSSKTLCQNAKTSWSNLIRTMLRPLFEVHTTSVLELRPFHITRDFQRPRRNIHEPKTASISCDTREFLGIPCSLQRARSLSWAM